MRKESLRKRDESKRPPKPASLKQRLYADSLARELGYPDSQAFMREWAGKNRRGFLTWNRRTAYFAIGELKRRCAMHRSQHPAGLESLQVSPHQTQPSQS